MTIRRFFAADISLKDSVSVVSDEFYHLTRVLRKKTGDIIELFDAMGTLAVGEIVNVEKVSAVVSVKERHSIAKAETETVVCPSILKRKAMDLLVEKLSEMGIDEIRPVIFSRTDVKFKEESLKRWRKISVESLKVNGKLWPTEIFPPVNINSIVSLSGKFKSRIIFDIEGSKSGISLSFPAIAVVGPPGDFTDMEKDNLKKNDFMDININDAVMKSETAAISAAAIMKLFKKMKKND
jgi:16S rRNA (uracil1498-N3)-methyltransferase